MTHSLLELLIFILLVAVTLNVFLTIRIARIVREARVPQELPFTLDLDSPAPPFIGENLATGAVYSLDTSNGRPVVMVFLSSGCGDCKRRLPELEAMLPAISRAGIDLLVVGMEDEKRTRAFLGATPLRDYVFFLDRKTRSLLNPRSGSPFYLFIDDRKIVRASNFIGDRNWQIFVEQMNEYGPEAVAGAANET